MSQDEAVAPPRMPQVSVAGQPVFWSPMTCIGQNHEVVWAQPRRLALLSGKSRKRPRRKARQQQPVRPSCGMGRGRSLQHMLTVNMEVVEAPVLVVIAGLRSGQSPLIIVGPAQACCSPRLVGPPVACQHECPARQFHHFCRGSHPASPSSPSPRPATPKWPLCCCPHTEKPTLVTG